MGDYYVFKLKEERNQLSERLMKLIRHLDNNKDIMNTVEYYLMANQIKAMHKYLRVLEARIEYTGSNRTTQDEDIPLYKERVRIGPYVQTKMPFPWVLEIMKDFSYLSTMGMARKSLDI